MTKEAAANPHYPSHRSGPEVLHKGRFPKDRHGDVFLHL